MTKEFDYLESKIILTANIFKLIKYLRINNASVRLISPLTKINELFTFKSKNLLWNEVGTINPNDLLYANKIQDISKKINSKYPKVIKIAYNMKSLSKALWEISDDYVSSEIVKQFLLNSDDKSKYLIIGFPEIAKEILKSESETICYFVDIHIRNFNLPIEMLTRVVIETQDSYLEINDYSILMEYIMNKVNYHFDENYFYKYLGSKLDQDTLRKIDFALLTIF